MGDMPNIYTVTMNGRCPAILLAQQLTVNIIICISSEKMQGLNLDLYEVGTVVWSISSMHGELGLNRSFVSDGCLLDYPCPIKCGCAPEVSFWGMQCDSVCWQKKKKKLSCSSRRSHAPGRARIPVH